MCPNLIGLRMFFAPQGKSILNLHCTHDVRARVGKLITQSRNRSGKERQPVQAAEQQCHPLFHQLLGVLSGLLALCWTAIGILTKQAINVLEGCWLELIQTHQILMLFLCTSKLSIPCKMMQSEKQCICCAGTFSTSIQNSLPFCCVVSLALFTTRTRSSA